MIFAVEPRAGINSSTMLYDFSLKDLKVFHQQIWRLRPSNTSGLEDIVP